MAEVGAGKALGPFAGEQVTGTKGATWPPCRRVGFVQSGGVRPIEDFSEYGHNATSATSEAIDLGGVDQIASMAKLWAESVQEDGRVRLRLSTGTVLEGRVHEGFRDASQRLPVSRALDLKQAYRQIAPSPALAPLCVIGV